MKARVLSVREAHDEAIELAGEAVALAAPLDFFDLKGYAHEALAEVLERAGRREEAVAAAVRAIGFYEQKGNVVSAARMRAVLDDLSP